MGRVGFVGGGLGEAPSCERRPTKRPPSEGWTTLPDKHREASAGHVSPRKSGLCSGRQHGDTGRMNEWCASGSGCEALGVACPRPWHGLSGGGGLVVPHRPASPGQSLSELWPWCLSRDGQRFLDVPACGRQWAARLLADPGPLHLMPFSASVPASQTPGSLGSSPVPAWRRRVSRGCRLGPRAGPRLRSGWLCEEDEGQRA